MATKKMSDSERSGTAYIFAVDGRCESRGSIYPFTLWASVDGECGCPILDLSICVFDRGIGDYASGSALWDYLLIDAH
jgi:hypothetical protein